jgi:hypothetical protein
MKAIQGYHLIKPEDLSWRPSNLMRIPNADYLERTGSENLSARLWRYPPKSAGTLHKHIRQEEFYFVLEGTGRLARGRRDVDRGRATAACWSARTSCARRSEFLWSMPLARPTIYLIAGCNGAGKTTFAKEFLPKEVKCLRFGLVS